MDRLIKLGNIKLIRQLKYFNNLLASRIFHLRILYNTSIGLMCFILTMIPIAAYLERTNLSQNMVICIQATNYLYLMFELLVQTFRFRTDTIILQDKLSLFPISFRTKYLYLLNTAFNNKKNLFYIFPFFVISIVLSKISFLLSLKSFFLFSSYFLFIQVWILNAYLLFSRLMDKHKQNLPIIYPLLLMGYILASSQKQWHFLGSIPILGWCGKAVEAELVGNSAPLIMAFWFYIGGFAIGILTGIWILRRK